MTFKPGLTACLLAGLFLTGCQTLPVPFASNTATETPREEAPVQDAAPSQPKPPENPPASADLNWKPNLDQPITQLQAQLELEESQLAKNQTLSSIAYLYDARLYMLFQDTLDYLPEKARKHEVELQNRWLDQRADAMTRAFLNDEDGEVARFAAGQAFIEETRKRIRELEQLRALIVIE